MIWAWKYVYIVTGKRDKWIRHLFLSLCLCSAHIFETLLFYLNYIFYSFVYNLKTLTLSKPHEKEERNRYKGIPHKFVYTSDLKYVSRKWNLLLLSVPLSVIEYRTRVRLIGKVGFDKIDIKDVASLWAYLYFPESTTYSILFRDIIPINYWNIIKILSAVI